MIKMQDFPKWNGNGNYADEIVKYYIRLLDIILEVCMVLAGPAVSSFPEATLKKKKVSGPAAG